MNCLRPHKNRIISVLFVALLALGACGADDPPGNGTGSGTSDKTPIGLTAPEFCAKCHPQHYDEWRTSMHAYGSVDPVFVAMNALAMKQTGGKVGQFCITCHAPSAAFRKQTPIGINAQGDHVMPLDLENPIITNGVQCITCHSIEKVNATANGQLALSDNVLYGPTATAEALQAHPIEKSQTLVSSSMCGSCHNVINPAGTLVENTFSEWYNSKYNAADPTKRTRCQDCHMPSYQGRITDDSAVKTLHRHTFVGVDQALIKGFPGKAEQAELVRKLLRGAATTTLERRPDVGDDAIFRFSVTNDKTGHNLPSGATADRQMWVHIRYGACSEIKQGDQVVGYAEAIDENKKEAVTDVSGMLDDNGDLMDGLHGTPKDGDPQLMLFNQIFYGGPNCPKQTIVPPPGACNPVTFPWAARRSEDYLIPVGATRYRDYHIPRAKLAAIGGKACVEARLLFRTFPQHLVTELQKAGVLKANALEPLPVVEMAKIVKQF